MDPKFLLLCAACACILPACGTAPVRTAPEIPQRTLDSRTGTIAFVAQENAVDNLFVVDLQAAGQPARRLTSFTAATGKPMANPPVWSPDGTAIAVQAGSDVYVWPYPESSSPGRKVCENANSMAWSDQGRKLLCLSNPMQLQAIDPRQHPEAGGATTLLSGGWPQLPQTSAFGLVAGGDQGNLIAFVVKPFRNGRAANSQIALAKSDGSGFHLAGPFPDRDYTAIHGLSFAPGAGRLAFEIYTATRALASIEVAPTGRANPAGRGFAAFASGPLLTPGQIPAWSPADPAGQLVWVENDEVKVGPPVAGNQSRRLTTGGHPSDPVFSPDGKRIAFFCDSSIGQLCVMNADGSAISPIGGGPTGRASRWPAWRPTGN